MAGLVNLLGPTVLGKNGVTVDVCTIEGMVGLYFSAHWCPPCRAFTPILAECYKKLKAAGQKFEVVFLSSDRDEKSFNEYWGSHPWLAASFDSDVKEKLSAKFNIRGIPTLILVDASTGKVITAAGREKVTADPEGKSFPWK